MSAEFQDRDAYRVLKFECMCGRCFYMAMSTRVPAVFAVALWRDAAVAAVEEQLSPPLQAAPEIPDFLPLDF